MEAYSSRFRGVGFDEVHAGFSEHRAFNLARKTSRHAGGHETRYLNNRTLFTAARAQELPARGGPEQENRFDFLDHKVWSA